MSFDENNQENTLIETVESFGKLKVEIWTSDFQHALEGHPEVSLDKIKTALKDPFKVIESKKSSRVCLFYSIPILDLTFGQIYFAVVVGVTGPGKGKLETAYETTYIKSGTVLWSKE
jgi:hypothetical protein